MSLPADYHLHSFQSPDSRERLEEHLAAAKKLGIPELCLTDHAEFDPYFGGAWTLDAAGAYEIFQSVREKEETIVLRFGYEFGLPDNEEELQRARERLPELPYDYVIASSHNYRGRGIFDADWYAGRSYPEACRAYLEAILDGLRLLRDDEYDAVGHIDCPCKVSKTQHGQSDPRVRLDYFGELFDVFARYLIERGKTFEINTSAWRRLGGLPVPGLDVLRRFRELGAEYVVFGSDAHRASDLGFRFAEAAELARSAGFRYYAHFCERRPEMQKL